MKEIILATSNPGKIRELKGILNFMHCTAQNELGIEDAEETGLSFIENALIKARHASLLTQKPALADDSGLAVRALNGAPGIYSARFGGQHGDAKKNIDLLLSRLQGIPPSEWQAYFYCCIVVLRHAEDPIPIIATGKWSGRIVAEPAGDQGFGYDPIFYLDDRQCTAAELSPAIKNSISHRAIALNQLRAQLEELE